MSMSESELQARALELLKGVLPKLPPVTFGIRFTLPDGRTGLQWSTPGTVMMDAPTLVVDEDGIHLESWQAAVFGIEDRI